MRPPSLPASSVLLALRPGLAHASAAGGGGGGGAVDPPTNVLVVVADDLGVEVLAAYGPQPNQPPTPVLDQLALDGVRFDHAWAAPLCTPARAALQTGRRGLRTGIGSLLGGLKDTDLGPYGLPLEEVTLAEMLALGAPDAWTSACIGKWHLGSEAVGGLASPNLAGYDHFAGPLGNLQGGETYTSWDRVVDGVMAKETGYATTVQVDDALAWIGQATEPWACVVNFNAPHLPYHAPPAALHTQDLSGAGPPTVDTRPYYNAMVEAMDTEIGRLLAGLGDAADHTLVVFLADNGTPAGVAMPPLDPKHAKGTFYEGGVRVPLIVRGPQVATPGSACAALVDVTDVWATAADVAGVDPAAVLPPGEVVDGVSLLPYLAQPDLPTQKAHVLTEVFRPNAADAGLPVYFGAGPLCQEDLGFGGPGTAVLSACGDVLGGAGTVSVQLTGAPPGAVAFLAGSFFANPVPVFGGFLVPNPQTAVYPFVTDAQGELVLPGLSSSVGPVDYHFQFGVVDAGQSFGYSISNAVKLTVQPRNTKAIRGERFKLIRDYNGVGPERMFDLESDPGELVELLAAGPLGAEASAAYAALSAELDAFLASH